jgi:hypothetical protein
MNERIRELAEQAGCSIDGMGFGEGDVEGLAELLVRECADLVKDYRDEMTFYRADLRIREHFGVEQ